MIRELSFNYLIRDEDGEEEPVRCLAEYEEPDYGSGISGGWHVTEIQLIDDDTNALLGRERAEKRYGIAVLNDMDSVAAKYDREDYEAEKLDRHDTREG